MHLLRRIVYYLLSLVTLFRGVSNWPLLFVLPFRKGPHVAILRDDTQYLVRGLMDVWIIKETNLDRDYERYGVPLQDGWTIVDIGAGLGDFAVFAARRVPHGHIYAYEPAPDSAELLRYNLALNGISNVDVHEMAVLDRAGILALDTSRGVAVQYKTTDSATSVRSSGNLVVHCISLSEVLASLPNGSCDFLKIDVEGAEYEMLLSLDEGSLGRVRRICLEYHEGVPKYSHADLERFFLAHGWRVWVYPSAVRTELGFLYAESPIVSLA